MSPQIRGQNAKIAGEFRQRLGKNRRRHRPAVQQDQGTSGTALAVVQQAAVGEGELFHRGFSAKTDRIDSAARSSSSGRWSAMTVARRRHRPDGTVGGRIPWTKMPAVQQRFGRGHSRRRSRR